MGFRVGVAHILQKNVTHSAAACVSISRSLIKTNGFAHENDKIWKSYKMGHRGLKIGFSDTKNLDFDTKIMNLMTVSCQNITFDTCFIESVAIARKSHFPVPQIIILV